MTIQRKTATDEPIPKCGIVLIALIAGMFVFVVCEFILGHLGWFG